ncbi:unnamed protein product [Acanthosepion pharaonis]|uniref:Uncharacterized protein n=1 Tax=Acanthosepion pharaonis TaxID=158019 RepID=A0A812B800_ACAPH|nr:unnamed protein product [Sepia pharaonis]
MCYNPSNLLQPITPLSVSQLHFIPQYVRYIFTLSPCFPPRVCYSPTTSLYSYLSFLHPTVTSRLPSHVDYFSLCLSPSLDHVTFLLPPPSFIGHCFFSYFFTDPIPACLARATSIPPSNSPTESHARAHPHMCTRTCRYTHSHVFPTSNRPTDRPRIFTRSLPYPHTPPPLSLLLLPPPPGSDLRLSSKANIYTLSLQLLALLLVFFLPLISRITITMASRLFSKNTSPSLLIKNVCFNISPKPPASLFFSNHFLFLSFDRTLILFLYLFVLFYFSHTLLFPLLSFLSLLSSHTCLSPFLSHLSLSFPLTCLSPFLSHLSLSFPLPPCLSPFLSHLSLSFPLTLVSLLSSHTCLSPFLSHLSLSFPLTLVSLLSSHTCLSPFLSHTCLSPFLLTLVSLLSSHTCLSPFLSHLSLSFPLTLVSLSLSSLFPLFSHLKVKRNFSHFIVSLHFVSSSIFLFQPLFYTLYL